MRVKDAVGRFGERVAVDHLEAAGLRVLDRNWRCRDGEIDVVGLDGDTLVVVEVKTRSSTGYGRPEDAVDRVKIARLRRLALAWMAAHRDADLRADPHGDPRGGAAPVRWAAVRFDVVAVLRGRDGLEVVHLRGAF